MQREFKFLGICLLLGFGLNCAVATAQNRVEFSLKNRQVNSGILTAELWATIADGANWEFGAINVAVSFNPDALYSANLNPALDANPELIAAGYSITQTPGSGFARLNFLKFSPPHPQLSGTMHLATVKMEIRDGSLKDDLNVMSSSPSSQIFHKLKQLNFNTGDLNGFGRIKPVPVTIDDLAVILEQPADIRLCPGGDALFTVRATGATIDYQWQEFDEAGGNFVDIPAALSASLSFNAVTPDDDGRLLRCVVTADGQTATSLSVSLGIDEAPTISEQPLSLTVCETAEAGFKVTASAKPAPEISWEVSDDGLNWKAIAEAKGHELLLTDVSLLRDGQQLRALISNSCGSVTSDAATLTVEELPVIQSQSADVNLSPGDAITLDVDLAGDVTSLQWLKDGLPLSDATESSLPLNNIKLSDAGDYQLRLEAACGSTIHSDPIAVGVFNISTIEAQVLLDGFWDGTQHRRTALLVELYAGAVLSSADLIDSRPASVNASGLLSVDFHGLAAGDYWIVLRHSGHLPIASAQPVAIEPGDTIEYNFSSPANVNNGVKALRSIVRNNSSFHVMIAGDLNGNSSIGSDDFIPLFVPSFGLSNPGGVPD